MEDIVSHNTLSRATVIAISALLLASQVAGCYSWQVVSFADVEDGEVDEAGVRTFFIAMDLIDGPTLAETKLDEKDEGVQTRDALAIGLPFSPSALLAGADAMPARQRLGEPSQFAMSRHSGIKFPRS